MTMKKITKFVVLAMVLTTMLCGCMKKTFTCSLCMDEVKEVPSKISVLGEEYEVCKDCKESLEALSSMLG